MHNPEDNWVRIGVKAAVLSVSLGLVVAWLYNEQATRKSAAVKSVNAAAMDRARTRDTSNFDNILQF